MQGCKTREYHPGAGRNFRCSQQCQGKNPRKRIIMLDVGSSDAINNPKAKIQNKELTP
jgi:hypothetical protein